MLTIDLTGHLAVVTGASGDLGRVMVRTLARCGADVAVHYHRNRQMADALAAEVTAMGRRAAVVQADVGDRSSVLAMRDAVRAALGAPGIVVANAVAQEPWRPVLELSAEAFESQYRTCVLQCVLLAQAFVPAMVDAGRGGRFIGVNTECAMQCFEGQAAYAAAKRGLDGVLRVLAREVGPHGVTVNQVAPGWTISDRVRAAGMESQPGYEATVPLRRRGTDQEIANAVAFLASDLASYITGAFVPVCGGNVMPAI